MRDKKRINSILKKLKLIWRENPDLRFNQIVFNANTYIPQNNIYYIEDNEFEAALNKIIDKLNIKEKVE